MKMYRKSHDTHMNHACIVLVYIVPSYGFSQMDLNDESSEEEDEPVTAAPAPHPQHAAAEPTPQPVEEPEDATQWAHTPEEAAAGVDKAEELVAAAAAAAAEAIKMEVEGTDDAAAVTGVAIKQKAARPGTDKGKCRAYGTPGCPFPDQHAGACPSLRAEGKRKRRLPAALRGAAMAAAMDEGEEWADRSRKRQRDSGNAHGQGYGQQPEGAAGAGTSASLTSPSTGPIGVASSATAAASAAVVTNGTGMAKKGYNCEHGRQRYRCKDCGGKGICEHGRDRYYCKDCGGKGICEHGQVRND